MPPKPNPFEPLFDRAVDYGTTSFEIIKLRTVDRTADISASIISRMFLLLTFSLFALSLNIALSFWLGDLLGKVYIGFLIVAGFYALMSLVLLLLHPAIKSRIYDALIRQMLK